MTDQPSLDELLAIAADIVTAYVSNNSVSIANISTLIGTIHTSLADLGSVTQPAVKQVPAVSIRSSVRPDHIVCLEDGKKLKMLKRHLMAHYQMTPADYRTKWGLSADYPMVAPNYAAKRSEIARKIGLGRERAATPAADIASTPIQKRQGSRRKLSLTMS